MFISPGDRAGQKRFQLGTSLLYTKPLAADFPTLRNGGGSPTISDGGNDTGINCVQTRGASRQHSFYLKSVGQSIFTVEAAFYCTYENNDPFWWNGIAVGDTSANQHAYIGLESNATDLTGPNIQSGYLSSLTASETNTANFIFSNFGIIQLFKIEVTATQIKTYWSPDGEGRVWHPFITLTISGNFTNGVTMVGFHQGYVSSSGTSRMWIPHFRIY